MYETFVAGLEGLVEKRAKKKSKGKPAPETEAENEATAQRLMGVVEALYHCLASRYARSASTPRPAILVGRSDESERSRHCRIFMNRVRTVPLPPQVLSAATAVSNMMDLMTPLG